MSRLAIKSISYNNLLDNLAFKRDILFFDKIIIDKGSFEAAKLISNFYIKNCENHYPSVAQTKEVFEFNQSEIDFLGDKGLLEISDLSSYLAITVNKDDRNAKIVEGLFSKLLEFANIHAKFLQLKDPELFKLVTQVSHLKTGDKCR